MLACSTNSVSIHSLSEYRWLCSQTMRGSRKQALAPELPTFTSVELWRMWMLGPGNPTSVRTCETPCLIMGSAKWSGLHQVWVFWPWSASCRGGQREVRWLYHQLSTSGLHFCHHGVFTEPCTQSSPPSRGKVCWRQFILIISSIPSLPCTLWPLEASWWTCIVCGPFGGPQVTEFSL